MKKRIILLLIICLFTGALSSCDRSEFNTSSIGTEAPLTNAMEETEREELELLYFKTDALVNEFFEKYNSISDDKIDPAEIKKGNIDTKALVYIDDFSMEVINSDRGFLSVSLSTKPENEETYLHNAFLKCIKGMKNNLSDEEIESAWSDIHSTRYMVDGYDLSGITITYIPYKELSKSYSNLRIDLTFPLIVGN